MLYTVGQKARLAASRGGWTGYITQIIAGPAEGWYLVIAPGFDPIVGAQAVAESDIDAGGLSTPSYSVNDQVTLYGKAGAVTAVSGDTYTVQIEIPRRHYTLTRTHTVPLWRIALENEL